MLIFKVKRSRAERQTTLSEFKTVLIEKQCIATSFVISPNSIVSKCCIFVLHLFWAFKLCFVVYLSELFLHENIPTVTEGKGI